MKTYFIDDINRIKTPINCLWAKNTLDLAGDTIVAFLQPQQAADHSLLTIVLEHFQLHKNDAILRIWQLLDITAARLGRGFYRQNMAILATDAAASTLEVSITPFSSLAVLQLNIPIKDNKFLITFNQESIAPQDLAISVMQTYKNTIEQLLITAKGPAKIQA